MTAPKNPGHTMTDDYTREIPYTSNVYPELSPVLIRQACRLNGVRAPDLTKPFHYCDLGCGYGLTLCLLAAAIPHAHFWGVDFNKTHIEQAQQMAARAKLSNVTLIEADFGAVSRGSLGLPAMDYTVAHGVMSWVGEQVRAEFLSALQRLVRQGGVAYVSYNAMPGQALLGVLRDVMHAHTAHMPCDVLEKIKHGLAYVRFLRDNEAPLFQQNPLLAKAFEDLERRDPKYLAHEYFTPHRRAFDVQEMAALMGENGFGFVGSLPLFKNVTELCAPQAFTDTLNATQTRLQREAHTDLICNTTFRRDIWVRQPATLADADTLIAETIYGEVHPRFALGKEASLDWVELSYDSPLFSRLLDHLSDRSGTAHAVRQALKTPPTQAAEVGYGLQLLCLGSQVVPLLNATHPPTQDQREAQRFRITNPFNRYVFERHLWKLSLVPVASEAAGTALLVNFFEALVMLGLEVCQGEAALQTWITNQLLARDVRLSAHQPQDSLQAQVARGVHTFLTHHLPKMLELGVLQALPSPAA